MVVRSVFFLDKVTNKVRNEDFSFTWFPGFSIKQKNKNVEALHKLICENCKISIENILEVSTKSNNPLGRELSSFNLFLIMDGAKHRVENTYQSSKVFKDILGERQHMNYLFHKPGKIHSALRKEDYSQLIEYNFFGRRFPLEPKNMFYDWLYITALKQQNFNPERLQKYTHFTDIEFNPKKSINCQARTLVLYLWLIKKNKIEDFLENPNKFYKK